MKRAAAVSLLAGTAMSAAGVTVPAIAAGPNSWEMPNGLGSKANPVKMGLARLTVYLAVYRTKDILASQGIYVDFIEFATTALRMEALLGNHIDISTGGWVDTIRLASLGSPIVAVSDVAEGGQRMVAGTKTGIKSAADLRGKKLAVSRFSSQEMGALWSLKLANVPASAVDIQYLPFADMPIALAKGDVDAFVGSEPFPSAAIAGGYGAATRNYYTDVPWGRLNTNLVTQRSLVSGNAALVARIVDALQAANKQIYANQAQAKAYAVEQFKVPQNAVDIVFGNVWFQTEFESRQVQNLIDSEYALQYIKTKPKLSDFVALEFTRRTGKR